MATSFKPQGNFTRDGVTTTSWVIFSDKPGVNYLDTRPELNDEDKQLFKQDVEAWIRSILNRNQQPSDQNFLPFRDDSGRLTSIRIVFNSDQAGYGTTRSRRKVLETLSSALFDYSAS